MSVHPHHPSNKPGPLDLILYSIAVLGCIYLLVVKKDPPPRMPALREIDAIANEAAGRAGAGNLVISADSDPNAVSILHPRAVYALWPRRLFAVQPNVIVLQSEQIGAATRPTDPSWLKEHNVTASVRFGLIDNQLTVERVDPVSP